MVSIAVCDDELLESLSISARIQTFMDEMQIACIIERFCSGKELLLSLGRFDIIFLDILMKGMDGMETARRCRELSFEKTLIFLSSSRSYVFDAYDVEAFHYLLKPIEEKKFAEIFARAVAAAEKKRGLAEEPFFIKSNGKTIILNRNHILYVESQNRMVNFHTANECLELYSDMRDLEQQLGRNFYRCHRGYIVNMGHIAEFGKDRIALTNGETICLSRRKYKEFVKVYMDYLRKGGALLESF